MPKIVILGSLRFGDYTILATPKKEGEHGELWNTEEGYIKASARIYPKITEADVILVYCPDGKIGEHTYRDIQYAKSKNKEIIFVKHEDVSLKMEGGRKTVRCDNCGIELEINNGLIIDLDVTSTPKQVYFCSSKCRDEYCHGKRKAKTNND